MDRSRQRQSQSQRWRRSRRRRAHGSPPPLSLSFASGRVRGGRAGGRTAAVAAASSPLLRFSPPLLFLALVAGAGTLEHGLGAGGKRWACIAAGGGERGGRGGLGGSGS